MRVRFECDEIQFTKVSRNNLLLKTCVEYLIFVVGGKTGVYYEKNLTIDLSRDIGEKDKEALRRGCHALKRGLWLLQREQTLTFFSYDSIYLDLCSQYLYLITSLF